MSENLEHIRMAIGMAAVTTTFRFTSTDAIPNGMLAIQREGDIRWAGPLSHCPPLKGGDTLFLSPSDLRRIEESIGK